MAKYSVVITVSIPEPVPAAGGMVGESVQRDTKLSRVRIHGQGG
jgi:hypothetical protein